MTPLTAILSAALITMAGVVAAAVSAIPVALGSDTIVNSRSSCGTTYLSTRLYTNCSFNGAEAAKKVSMMTVAAIFTARAVVAVAAIVGTVTAAVEVGSPVVPVAVVAAASSGLHQYTKVGDR
jgi:hypothetical protein